MPNAAPYRIASALAAVVLCVAMRPPSDANAEGSGMDPLLEATLQLKVQSYDRKIAKRIAQKRFVVGILYKAGSSDSEGAANEMRDAFERVSVNYRINGIKPTITTIAFDADRLTDRLTTQGVSMIYVTRGLEASIPAILTASAQLNAPTATRMREHVASGVTIGIVVDRRKPKIVVNLKSMQAVGMELDAEMLSLAEILR